jgi:hypothetical protein
MLQSLMHVQTNSTGVVSRRMFLRSIAVGAAGAGLLGWKEAVAVHADELRKRGMACILLFMRGGPSQMETFDPKPGTDHGGPTKAIDTAVSGIQIAESWPNLAKAMKDIALIRSVTNREGEHVRATYQLHTGYIPSGTVKYPSIGSIAASEIGPSDFDLPHFVSIGNRLATIGSGFLGMSVAPFVVGNPEQMPTHVELPRGTSVQRFGRRLDLLKDLEQEFAQAGGKPRVEEHQGLYGSAAQMVLSPRLKAFDIHQEKDEARNRYGRTPKINPNSGRDHFPMAFTVAMAGGGIRGGKVIGATSADSMTVKDRPVSVPDLFCTFYQALKINPRKENLSTLGRPIKIVDGGKPVQELFV